MSDLILRLCKCDPMKRWDGTPPHPNEHTWFASYSWTADAVGTVCGFCGHAVEEINIDALLRERDEAVAMIGQMRAEIGRLLRVVEAAREVALSDEIPTSFPAIESLDAALAALDEGGE